MNDRDVNVLDAKDDDESALLRRAYEILQGSLRDQGGIVSSKILKGGLAKELSIEDEEASNLLYKLRFFSEDAAEQIGLKDAKTFHHGRSFYSPEKYDEAMAPTEQEFAEKEERFDEWESGDESQLRKRDPKRNGEEARLGGYVKTWLEDNYTTEFTPEETEYEYVFDVHTNRPGGSFENVDLIAVHWLDDRVFEVVTVEVKLAFHPGAVYQACSYARFSHRVWVACPVSAGFRDAGSALQMSNPELFDHVVAQGIGILACVRAPGRGGSYQPIPVHWPRLQSPDNFQKMRFQERYRPQFEEARVLESQKRRYPSAR